MPSENQHRGKAERSRAFLNSIALNDFPEWLAIAAYYTAFHVIERVRAAAGDGHSTTHEDRLGYTISRLKSTQATMSYKTYPC
jgi:hypothetical protein